METKISLLRGPGSVTWGITRKGVATLAAAFYPKDVIVRLRDFKTNEYARLVLATTRLTAEVGAEGALALTGEPLATIHGS